MFGASKQSVKLHNRNSYCQNISNITKCHAAQVHVVVKNVENVEAGCVCVVCGACVVKCVCVWCVCVCVCVCCTRCTMQNLSVPLLLFVINGTLLIFKRSIKHQRIRRKSLYDCIVQLIRGMI